MKNKILKTFLFFVLFSTLLITASFAVEIKEDVADYESDVYIIGSTRFDANQTITATMAANAGLNEAKVQVALGNNISKLNVTIYFYDAIFGDWYEINKVAKADLIEDTTTIKNIEDNLNIFYEEGVEKTLEVKYNGDVDKNSLPSNVEYKDGKFIVPATTFNFTFTETKEVNGEKVVVTSEVSTNVDKNVTTGSTEKVEIKRNPEVKFQLAEEIVLNEPTEFTVSTIANDYAGVMVVGTGSVNPDNVSKLEYAVGDQWVEMTGESIFGNEGAGFPLQDATSKFRVTFNKVGEYNVTFAIKNLETGKIMADVATKTNVTTTKNVSNLEDLEKALSNESVTDIKLLKDIELANGFVVTRTLTLNLNGKTIKASDKQTSTSLITVKSGNLTIKGNGIINSASQGNDYSMAVWAQGTGSVTIEDGTFTNLGGKDFEDNGTTPNNNELIYANGNGKIIIKDGSFIGNTENKEYQARYTLNLKDEDNKDASIVVYGGTFTGYDPANSKSENPTANLVAEGYKSVKVGDKYTVLPYDAENVTDEAELRTLIAEGGTIKLGGDIELSEGIVITNTVILNLNGKTIKASDKQTSTSLITVKSGNLTIKGNGTINSASQGNDYSMAVWAQGTGSVTIEDGTFTNLGGKDFEDNGTTPNNNELIYANGNGKIIIKDGNFIGNTENKEYQARYTLNLRDEDNKNASIVVYGGTFTGYDPANSKSENPTANLVAEGYESIFDETNNIYTVVEKSN